MVHVIYSGVSGQCSHTKHVTRQIVAINIRLMYTKCWYTLGMSLCLDSDKWVFELMSD